MDTAFPLATELLQRQDVSGVFRSAFRYRAGAWVREDCIAVGVKQKMPLAELKESVVIPSTIGGVATDVIECNPKLSLYSEQYSVVCGGISIGNVTSESSGTLGGVFRDTVNSVDCGLTNFHVMADPDLSAPDVYAIHPSEEDGGTMDATSRVGISTRWMLNSRGDAAIFTLTKPGALSMLASQVVLTDVVMPQALDEVEKVGRTTGVTQGVVSGLGYVSLDYSDFGQGTISMYCCSIVPLVDPDELIADGGDSGAIWYLQSTGAGVGLHVAHDTGPFVAYACILGYVLEDLDCEPIFTVAQDLQRTGTMSQSEAAELSRTGTTNIIPGQPALTAKVFAVQDSETLYADFDEWAIAQGFDDGDAFLAEFGYETVEEFVFSFLTPDGEEDIQTYATVDDFLLDHKIKSLKDTMLDTGVTF